MLSGTLKLNVSDPFGVIQYTDTGEVIYNTFLNELPSAITGDTRWPTKTGAYHVTGCILQESGECDPNPNLSDTSFFIQYPPEVDWTHGKMFIILNGRNGRFDTLDPNAVYDLVDPDEAISVERYPGLLVVNLNRSERDIRVINRTTGEERIFTPHSELSTIYLWKRRDQPYLYTLTDAATFAEGPISPGQIVTLWSWAATHNDPQEALETPLSTSSCEGQHGNTRVVFTDSAGTDYNAPFFYCSQNQLNVQVPVELPGDSAKAKVVLNESESNSVDLTLQSATPAIFVVENRQGFGPIGAVVDAITGRLITPEAPARPGDWVSIYANGLGPVLTRPPSGALSGLAPLSGPIKIALSDHEQAWQCEYNYAGLAPGFVALYQANARLPENLPSGTYELVLEVDGGASNTVALPVAAN